MPDPVLPYLTLLPYCAVAVAIASTLILFASLKRELYRNARRERHRVDQMLQRLETAAPQPAPGQSEPVFIPVASRPGLNIDRRIHAMRLLRKGEEAAHVAAALGVPRQEIELLIRVREFIAKAPASAAGAGGA